MVDPETLKHRGVQVIYVDGVFHDVVGEVVGLAVFETGLDPAACHPHGKTAAMVVAPVVVLGQFSLGVNGSPEFPAANHNGVLEQSALLEIAHQSRSRLVHVLALLANLGREAAVLIPSAMKELYERHAALRQPAGDQAIVGKTAFSHGIFAVEIEYVLGFVLQIDQFGHAGLHAVSHLVLGDPGIDLRVTRFRFLGLVDLGYSIEHGTAHVLRNAFGVGQVKDGVTGASEFDSLMFGGKKPASPQTVVQGLGLPAAF